MAFVPETLFISFFVVMVAARPGVEHGFDTKRNSGKCNFMEAMSCVDVISDVDFGSLGSPGGMESLCSATFPRFLSCVNGLQRSCLTGNIGTALTSQRQGLETLCNECSRTSTTCMGMLGEMGDVNSAHSQSTVCSTIYPQFTTCMDGLPASCDEARQNMQQLRQMMDQMCQSAGDIMTGATCGAGNAHSSGTPDLAFGFCEGAESCGLTTIMPCLELFPTNPSAMCSRKAEIVVCDDGLPESCRQSPTYLQYMAPVRQALNAMC